MERLKIFTCLFFLSSTTLYAQFKNIKLDEQTDKYVCEPSIAINPKNPANIVAGSVLDNVYYTKDGGETWHKEKMQSSFGVYGDPALITDRKGNFYYFHLSDPTHGKGGYDSEKLDRMVVQRSFDGGETWTDGESIGYNHPKDQDKEWPAVDSKGNLYLTWTQFDKYGDESPDCQSVILFSASKNGGRKWCAPVLISHEPGNCIDSDDTAEGAVPAVTADGKIFVAWSNHGKIFMDRSYDDGKTWLANDIVVADQPGGWDLKIPGHDRCNGMPVLMADNSKGYYRGSLYLVWADQRNGAHDTDVWFTRTNNHGDNWSTPVKIGNETKGHQYLPWMAVDPTNGYVYILYYDRSKYDDLRTDVCLAWSTNGGLSFKNVKISETPFIPSEETFFGDYLNIAAYNSLITPIWTRMDNGKTSIWTAIIKQEMLAPTK